MKRLLNSAALAAALSLAAVHAYAAPAAPAAVQRDVLPDDSVPERYVISVQPDAGSLTFKGKTRVDFKVLKATDRLTLNQLNLKIEHAALAGRDGGVKIVQDDEGQKVAFVFDKPLAPGRYTLDIGYSGVINEHASGMFVARYNGASGPKSLLATQFEPGDARRFAPMFDQPDRKAVFEVEAIVPEAQTAISNMPQVSSTPAGPGLKLVRFAPSPKMSSYLLYFGVGDTDRVSAKHGDVDVGVITRAGESEKGRYALKAAQDVLGYYDDYFATPYPLPKLDHLAVPGAGGFGAMENWGAILYFENALLLDPALSTASDQRYVYTVVAHETAHQWFGNLVTMSWWDDLWLNEGFASWMETKSTDKFNPEWNMWLTSSGNREGAMDLDAKAATHPIVTPIATIEQANLAFDTITYQKGEAVIRMLEAYVGETAFRDGVRAYMKKHAYGNTVTDDLWQALQAASKTNVVDIAHDFTLQPGVPLITVESATCKAGSTELKLSQGRFGADAGSKAPLKWHVPVVARTLGGAEARAVVYGDATMKLAGCGPVIVDAGDSGYFRVKYDDAQFKPLAESFTRLSAADQLGLLYDTWALGETGYASIDRYLDLASRLPADADPEIWGQAAGVLGHIAELYEGQPGEAAYRAYARKALGPVLAGMGWDVRPGEKAAVPLLRESLIRQLAGLGDEAVLAEARRRFDAEAKGEAIPAGIRRSVIYTVARFADAPTWELLRQRAAEAKSPLEQRLYLGALARVKDPVLAEKSLNLFLTDQTPKQLAPSLIRTASGLNPDLAWRFSLANQQAIYDRLDPLQQSEFLADVASASSDPKRAAELRAWAEKNLAPESRGAAEKAATEILFSAEVRAKRLPEISGWLAAHGG